MSQLKLSVPPGFTISTECCDKFCNDKSWNQSLPKLLWDEVVRCIGVVESEMEKEFGNPENPLLLSVRSGAAISMPGMVSKDEYCHINSHTVSVVSKFYIRLHSNI
jgi:pyruvate,orthophosphate dikinase